MSTATATMGLLKAVDADNAEAYLVGSLATSLDLVDAHTHGGGALGKTLATNAFPSGAVLPSPAITTPTISGHEHVSGSAPTIAAGAGIGTGGAPAVSISGRDGAGIIVFTTGNTGVGTHLATVTFNAAYVTPIIQLTGVANVTQVVTATNVGVNSFELHFATAPAANTIYSVYYTIVDAN